MKVIDIITSSRKVLDTTYSLYTSVPFVRNKENSIRCINILKEVKKIMKKVIIYLLKDFDNYKLVLKNEKNCEFTFKTQSAKKIENIILARKATFLIKESTLLRKKIKKNLKTSELNISIPYTT